MAVPIKGAVRVMDVVETRDAAAVVMELVEAPSLRALFNDGPVPAREAAAIGAQVADALAHAHSAGIVHRDVKPENVLVGRDKASGEVLALLSDFGIAGLLDGATLTTTQPGTSAYTPPEAFKNDPSAPSRDVYALGIVLYEMTAGHRPFQSTSAAGLMREHFEAVPQRPAEVSEHFWTVMERCLRKDPTARPTATQVAAHLSGSAPLPPETCPSASPKAALRRKHD